MENSPKDDVQAIADRHVFDVLEWHLKVNKGTLFKHKINGTCLIVVTADFMGAKCKDSKGKVKYYGFKNLVDNYEIVKTDMAKILYDERTKKESV